MNIQTTALLRIEESPGWVGEVAETYLCACTIIAHASEIILKDFESFNTTILRNFV